MTPTSPEVGDRTPAFSLPDSDGTVVSLADLLAGGDRVLVYVYPPEWSPVLQSSLVRLSTFPLSHAYTPSS